MGNPIYIILCSLCGFFKIEKMDCKGNPFSLHQKLLFVRLESLSFYYKIHIVKCVLHKFPFLESSETSKIIPKSRFLFVFNCNKLGFCHGLLEFYKVFLAKRHELLYWIGCSCRKDAILYFSLVPGEFLINYLTIN